MNSVLKGLATDIVAGARAAGEDSVKEIVSAGATQAETFIRAKLDRIVGVVHEAEKGKQQGGGRFVGIDESSVLRFVPDHRSISGVAPLLLAIFCVVALPGGMKWLAIVPFLVAIISAFFGYVWQSKVDIPEGHVGVICDKGEPATGVKSHPGRNWIFDYMRHVPFVVAANQNQVATIDVANFTKDFASVKMRLTITFRISEPERFAVHTSPAVAMYLMQQYARYIGLRMITSIDDARVKFTGRDDLKNVAEELNRYLGQYGITVLKVTMPEAENAILEDLEQIRIAVNGAGTLQNSKQMRVEGSVKAVESAIRRARRNALALAQGLVNEGISFSSAVSVAVNGKRQELVIDAQRQITERQSELLQIIAKLSADIAKARAIGVSISGLSRDFELRMAQLKRKALIRLLPKNVSVLNVPGIGSGIGMSLGNELVGRMIKPEKPALALVPNDESQAASSA